MTLESFVRLQQHRNGNSSREVASADRFIWIEAPGLVHIQCNNNLCIRFVLIQRYKHTHTETHRRARFVILHCCVATNLRGDIETALLKAESQPLNIKRNKPIVTTYSFDYAVVLLVITSPFIAISIALARARLNVWCARFLLHSSTAIEINTDYHWKRMKPFWRTWRQNVWIQKIFTSMHIVFLAYTYPCVPGLNMHENRVQTKNLCVWREKDTHINFNQIGWWILRTNNHTNQNIHVVNPVLHGISGGFCQFIYFHRLFFGFTNGFSRKDVFIGFIP